MTLTTPPLGVVVEVVEACIGGSGPVGRYRRSMKIVLIILCFFLPFLAVLIKKGPCMAVLWAFLLQLLGHLPGVIYGIVKVTED